MNERFNRIKDITDNIEGWLTEKEGKFLYENAKKCYGKGVIVEIGSWKGKSTIWLAKGSKEGNNIKIYAIDPHTGSPEHKKLYGDNIWTFDIFKENIKNANVEDIVEPIVDFSFNAVKNWNKQIELLFIDGAHDYETVEKDFLMWEPFLVEGGIIAFHDTTSCMRENLSGEIGPKKVVDKYIFPSKKFKNIGVIDTITYAEKCKKNTIFDRIKSRFAQVKKFFSDTILFYWAYYTKIPRPIRKIGKVILWPILKIRRLYLNRKK